MDNQLKYSMLVLEGLEIDWKFDNETRALIKELTFESAQLDEGIIDTIKQKTSNFVEKLKSSTANILPSITQKFDNLLNQVRAKQGDEVADAIESEMNKKAGANWKGSAQKVAAALVVASSLAQASPAEARDMFMRMSPFQAQQYELQAQANWARKQAMHREFERQREFPRYQQGYGYQQRGGGQDAAALAIGVMIGAALGAALNQGQ